MAIKIVDTEQIKRTEQKVPSLPNQINQVHRIYSTFSVKPNWVISSKPDILASSGWIEDPQTLIFYAN